MIAAAGSRENPHIRRLVPKLPPSIRDVQPRLVNRREQALTLAASLLTRYRRIPRRTPSACPTSATMRTMSSPGPLSTDLPAQKLSTVTKMHDWLTSPGGRLLRYGAVLLIVGAAVYLSLTGWLQVCEVVESDADGVTRTCSGPDLTSAGVLAAVIFVLLLLWPDLSEFSAFGVTLKKLVQRVDEKVSETRLRTRDIDSATTDARARLEILQSTVAGQGNDVGRRLEQIQVDLQSFYETERRNRSDGFDSGIRPARDVHGWSRSDRIRFMNGSQRVAGTDALGNALDTVITTVGYPEGVFRAEFGVNTRRVLLEGLLVELFRTYDDYGLHQPAENDARFVQMMDLLKSIEQMLLALLAGIDVDEQSLQTAAALLLVLRRG
jgi:hypothetical protein